MRDTHSTKRHRSFWAGCRFPSVALSGLALLIVGCTQSQSSQTRHTYFIKVKDGHVVFTVGKLDLVLEEMEPKAGLQSTGWLTVPNRGSSGNGMQSANGVTVKQSWKDGVNTITVNELSFDLIASHHATVSGNHSNEFSRASQIKIGDQTFPFTESKTIYVLEDGTISLTAAAERESTDSPASASSPTDLIRPPRMISAKVWRRHGHAVIEIGKLTVEFENISIGGEDASLGTVQDLHCPLSVESGTRQVQFGDELTMKESLRDGTATISFNESSFQLIDDASKVRFGEQNFAVEKEQTIVVAEDGTVSVKTGETNE